MARSTVYDVNSLYLSVFQLFTHAALRRVAPQKLKFSKLFFRIAPRRITPDINKALFLFYSNFIRILLELA